MKKSKKIFITIFSMFLFLIGFNIVNANSNFKCTLNSYSLEYNTKGELVAAYGSSGKKVEKYLSSYFKPKSVDECPTEEEAKISFIDGRRTLYVAQKSEFVSPDENGELNSTEDLTEDLTEDSTEDLTEDLTEDSTERRRPKVNCGNVTCIPKVIPRLTSLAFTIIQIAVPILLIIMGSIDLFKGITAGKEDEMKKGQQMFIKRLIVGALIFFVIAIVKLLVSVVANATDTDNISKCISCFMDNNCTESTNCN